MPLNESSFRRGVSLLKPVVKNLKNQGTYGTSPVLVNIFLILTSSWMYLSTARSPPTQHLQQYKILYSIALIHIYFFLCVCLLRNYPALVPEFQPFLQYLCVYPTLTPLRVQSSQLSHLFVEYVSVSGVYTSLNPPLFVPPFVGIHFHYINPSHLSISFRCVVVQGSYSISTY